MAPPLLRDAPFQTRSDGGQGSVLTYAWVRVMLGGPLHLYFGPSPVSSMDFVKHLETLGLEPGASPEEVRRAFRERMADWHPGRHPDSPSFQRDGVQARGALEASYRYLMNRYGLDPVDIDESASRQVAEVPTPPPTRPVAPPRAPRARGLGFPLGRMVMATAAVFLLLVFVVPAARDGRLSRWTDAALEFSLGKLAAWFPMPGAPLPGRVAIPEGRAVQSLPRLTKAQVLQRYGEPRAREAGRWSYTGFSIHFQDDSIASLLVRDTIPR